MSKISNYEELVLERKKLESDLIHYRSTIQEEIDVLKQKMESVKSAVSFFTPAPGNNHSNKLLEVGANLGIEILIRQKLLSKSGWFTQLVVPYVLKKVSSFAIEKVQEVRK